MATRRRSMSDGLGLYGWPATALAPMRSSAAWAVSKPTIRRWRTRYVEAGVDGLCRDKTRPPGKAPLAADVVMRVIEKTKTETPPDATHWSLRTMAKAVGIAPSSVQAIWKAHELKPHLVATFKLSNDPRFAEKVEDVVGLYVNPPEHAIVCRWTRSPRSRHSTAPSRACR